MRRRRIIIVLTLWFLIIIFLIVSHLQHQPKKVNLYKATPGGKNILFPSLAGPSTIDFFTGSAFAAYDTSSQTSKTISPQFILPTVSQVRWSKAGVMFLASDYTAADNLFAALNDKGLPTNKEYWWIYSFSDQKLNVVTPRNAYFNVVDAFWNASGKGYCYISSDGSLYLSSDQGHAIAKVDTNDRIKQFSGSTITLAENGTIRQIDTSTHRSKDVVNAVFQDAYVSADGKTMAYVLNTHPVSSGVVPGDLYKVNTDNLKASRVLSGFTGAMAGSGGNLYAGYVNDQGNNLLRFFPVSGKSIDYSFGSSLNKGDTIGTILPVNPGTIYVISRSNNLVEVTDQKKTVSTPVSQEYKIQTDLYQNGFEIHYDPYKDTYEVDISANPFIAYQNAALDYIRKQGVDPNQLNITWRGFEGVDTTNPSVDTSPLNVGDFRS